MRKLMILFACALCLTAGYAASPESKPLHWVVQFRLSKDGANYNDFLYDRNDCLSAATKRAGLSIDGDMYYQDPKAFYACITGKGYKVDSNGPFKAKVYGRG
jgi:hypothetical protein